MHPAGLHFPIQGACIAAPKETWSKTMSTLPITLQIPAVFNDGCAGRIPTPADLACAQAQAGKRLLALPFDTLRTLYWIGVRSGTIARSLIGWGEFEQALDSVEALTLGPWARRR